MVAKVGKLLLLSFILTSCFYIPILAEGEGTETGTETNPEPSPVPEEDTSAKDAAQMIIDYMEGVRQSDRAEEEAKKKAEEEEAARIAAEEAAAQAQAQAEAEEAAKQVEAEAEKAAEEAAQLNAIAVEQENLNATYTSNTNVILGYAQKYKYYYAYDVSYIDGYYTRYNRYIYCWDGFPAFKVVGNKLQFTGDALFVSALYSGDTSSETVSNSITLGGNRINAYSNIPQLAYPALYQIDNSTYESTDEIIQVICLVGALLFGCFITKRFLIDG